MNIISGSRRYEPIDSTDEQRLRGIPGSMARNGLLVLGIALTALFFVAGTFEGVPTLGHHDYPAKVTTSCDPGILGNITSQLPFKLWKSDYGLLPYYSNFDIDEEDQWW